ncbi:hypothetical protein [Vibrio phage vB_VibM_83AMN]|nr:hypothetical protein [Vibrio phage vB_VibM_83AMN]
MNKTKFKLEEFLTEWKKVKVPLPRSRFRVRNPRIQMVCHCGKEYLCWPYALKRGHGLSCSRACAANRRFHNLPAGKMKEVRSE